MANTNLKEDLLSNMFSNMSVSQDNKFDVSIIHTMRKNTAELTASQLQLDNFNIWKKQFDQNIKINYQRIREGNYQLPLDNIERKLALGYISKLMDKYVT